MHEPHERDLIAAYNLDVKTPIGHGRALVPRHVMAMPHKERAKWLKENGLVLPVGGGSWACGSWGKGCWHARQSAGTWVTTWSMRSGGKRTRVQGRWPRVAAYDSD